MKVLVVWLTVLMSLFLLAIIKVGIRFSWENREAELQILIWKLHIALPKEKKRKSAAAAAEKIPQKMPKKTENGKLWLRAGLAHWQELLALIACVLRTPTLDLLRIHLTVGGPDPAACAMTYGRTCEAIGMALPILGHTFRIKRKDIQVVCDYGLEQTVVLVQAEITVRIYEIVILAAASLGLLLCIYRETKNNKRRCNPYESSSS